MYSSICERTVQVNDKMEMLEHKFDKLETFILLNSKNTQNNNVGKNGILGFTK